ncbi:methionine ABC transporter substrate-binding protein [Klebsiella pneumoniae]|nr:methionine ABC transporter substrate-binding protein [Klebsiella pneumoniae]
MKYAAFKLAGVALSLSLVWTSAQAAALRVAADPVPHAEILNYIKKIDPSLDLKVVELTSGVNANELLASGDVDANYFQHVPYLKDQEKALGKTFAVAATVHIEPLGIYSHKHKDFSSLPENATVAVPNNTTNLSRALFLLQAQKLIKLDPKFTDPATTLATPKDIVENPKHLKILEIESPQIPRSLDDVDLAVINGNYALEAGLVPAKDALGLESAEHNPYANILVTTPALANDPRIKALAKDLTSPQVAEFIRKTYNGSVIPVALSHDNHRRAEQNLRRNRPTGAERYRVADTERGNIRHSRAQWRRQKYAHPLSQFTGAAHLGPHSGERTGYYPVEQGGAAGLSPAHRDDFPALQSAACPHRR